MKQFRADLSAAEKSAKQLVSEKLRQFQAANPNMRKAAEREAHYFLRYIIEDLWADVQAKGPSALTKYTQKIEKYFPDGLLKDIKKSTKE